MAGEDPAGAAGMTELGAPAEGVRLVLVRHGQTPSNVRKALDTVPPGPGLTEHGQRQAHDLAQRLAHEKVRSITASLALRAQETAAPLATRHALGVSVADGLHEVYVGDLEGRDDQQSRLRFEEVYARWHVGEIDAPMPGGETGRQALNRFVASARPMVEGVSSGSIVLVSHGAMLRLVAGQLAPNVEGANAAYLPNTGVIVLEASLDSVTGWVCVQWDGLDG